MNHLKSYGHQGLNIHYECQVEPFSSHALQFHFPHYLMFIFTLIMHQTHVKNTKSFFYIYIYNFYNEKLVHDPSQCHSLSTSLTQQHNMNIF